MVASHPAQLALPGAHGRMIAMSFAFHPNDTSVAAGFRRIARAELKAAIRALKAADAAAGPTPKAVHGLRKHSKKLRGLLRLVRPVFRGFPAANIALRDGARDLAALRDAEVRLSVFRRIAAGLPAGTVPERADAVMQEEIAQLRAPVQMEALRRDLRRDFKHLHRQARGWKLTASGWDALEPGLTESWRAARRGCKASARAFARGQHAPFHEWRKAVKHHWYQARLLAPIRPDMMALQIAAMDALGEDLGDHNDLDLLLVYLAGHADPAISALAGQGPFGDALRGARDDLARRALWLGALLLAEKPASLSRRWRGCWQDWRRAGRRGRNGAAKRCRRGGGAAAR